jgi:monovalent cation:H+ antiporter-2, CPA2 family
MHHPELILTLACVLSAALGFGYLTQRIGLSPIVGYLLAGIAVGPHTPGFVADAQIAEQLAEMGVILLMFGVGLTFHLEDLLAVRAVVIPGAIVQIASSILLGMCVGFLFGYSWPTGVVFGVCLSVASTVVLTRILGERNELHTPLGHTAMGWLVLQDVYAVMVLVLLPKLVQNEGEWGQLAIALGITLLKIIGLLIVVLLGGGRAIPWILKHVAETRSRELFTLAVLVLALGIAVVSAILFGVSMALGAFLAGMVVGRSDFSLRAATDAMPMRDAFAVLFFVSVGMLFDPLFLYKSPAQVVASLLVVMLATPLVTFLIVSLLGRPIHTALGLGLALGQIGEFSFIVGAIGKKLNILPDDAFQVIVAVAILSISANPILYRLTIPVDRWISRQPWLARQFARGRLERVQIATASAEINDDAQYRAVVVGYGPVGRTLVRLLQENKVEPSVIEMNLATVQQLRKAGVNAIYGDASHAQTLQAAGIERCGTLFLSSSTIATVEEVIRLARELNPNIRVVARSAYLRERNPLLKAGATEVFAGEGEVSLAMAEAVLRELGATAEQIDRERDRVRAEIEVKS